MVNQRETGKDGVAIVAGDPIPFTNCSYDIEFGTTSSDYNTRLEQFTAYTDAHTTGSLELEGSSSELRGKVMNGNGRPRQPFRIIVRDSEGGVRFNQVRVNTFGREFPGGDKSTTTLDWEADTWSLI